MITFRTILSFAFIALLSMSALVRAEPASPPVNERMEPMPAELKDVTIDEKSGSVIPLDLRFLDEKGKSVALRDYFHADRPVVIQLSYFSCPMLCGLVSTGLVESLNELTLSMGKDFELINLSFDPSETPTLAALKKQSFLDAYNRPAGAGAWHFLTGDPAAIKQITNAVGFKYKWVEASGQFSHPAALILLTPDGRISRYLYGVKYDPSTLRLSLVEASGGKIGTTTDRFLLTCFHYDSYAGKYNLAAMNLMRIAGVMTVIALGAIIGVLLRREMRNRRMTAAQNYAGNVA